MISAKFNTVAVYRGTYRGTLLNTAVYRDILFFAVPSPRRNSKINNQTWPGFELIQYSIHVHPICKFQEDPIKIEPVMLMTVKLRLFSNQGNVTLMI